MSLRTPDLRLLRSGIVEQNAQSFQHPARATLSADLPEIRTTVANEVPPGKTSADVRAALPGLIAKTGAMLVIRGLRGRDVVARLHMVNLIGAYAMDLVMQRDAAIATLKAHETELKQLGVRHLYLFGSTARGEAREDSDVDLFFDYEKGKFGLFDLMDVKERASAILGSKADIMTRDSLHRTLRARIEAVAVQVF